MLDREELIKARIIIGNQIRLKMKEDMGKSYLDSNKTVINPYSRLCIIAGELDVLIKIVKEQNDRNKQ